jgi:hypothetical protein
MPSFLVLYNQLCFTLVSRLLCMLAVLDLAVLWRLDDLDHYLAELPGLCAVAASFDPRSGR